MATIIGIEAWVQGSGLGFGLGISGWGYGCMLMIRANGSGWVYMIRASGQGSGWWSIGPESQKIPMIHGMQKKPQNITNLNA